MEFNNQNQSTTNTSFKLSKSNWIFAAIVAILMLVLKTMRSGFGPKAIGTAIGGTFFYFVVAVVIALLFWSIMGKKTKVASNAFNITLGVFVLIVVSTAGLRQSTKKNVALKAIKQASADYKLSLQVNPDGVDSSYAILSTKLQSNIGILAQESSGDEKELYLMIQDFLKNIRTVATNWQNAFNEVQEPRILDFSFMDNQDEFDYQVEIVNNYIKRSKEYQLLLTNQVGYLKNKLAQKKLGSSIVSTFMTAVIKKNETQKPILEPLIDAHILYGQSMLGLIQILEEEQGEWFFDNDIVEFGNDESIDEYNGYIETLLESENEINRLSEDLIRVL